MSTASEGSPSPVAQFVIERVSGTGYRVTSSAGPEAPALEKNAIPLLDKVKQPGSRSNGPVVEWIGPIRGTRLYVGVMTTIKESGESRYHQSWFSTRAVDRSRRAIWTVVLISLLFGIVIGVIGGNLFGRRSEDLRSPSDQSTQAGAQPEPHTQKERENTILLTRHQEFQSQLLSSQEVREKLQKYLQQDGFSADTSRTVVEEQRSVKLLADLDVSPPPSLRESIKLNNIEVRYVLALLDYLKQSETYRPDRDAK